MVSHTTDSTPPPKPSGPSRAPRLGMVLWAAGGFYLLGLFVFLFPLNAYLSSLFRGLGPLSENLAGALLSLLFIAAIGHALFTALRAAGVPRPLGALTLLSLLVVGAHAERIRASQYLDHGLAGAIGLLLLLTVVVVVGGIVTLALLHLTRGRALVWTALVLPLTLTAQFSLDQGLINTRERQATAAEREEFDRVLAALIEHPATRVVLDLEGWTAESVADDGTVTYVSSADASISVSTWSTHDYDPRRSEADYPGFLRSGCVDEEFVCEDFDDPPISGVVFQHESLPEWFTVRAQLGPEVGSSVDLFPGLGAVVLLSDEVIELAHGLRPFEEEDAALLAEQITGHPRP